MTLTQRERKVDVEKLTNEQTDELSTQIGQKVREQVDETVNKINTFTQSIWHGSQNADSPR